MSQTDQFQCYEIERCFLHCLLKDPDWLAEIRDKIDANFFKYGPNQAIFSMIKALYEETHRVDAPLVVYRLSLIGLNMVDGGITANEYVDSIANMSVNLDAKFDYLDNLVKLYWSRDATAKLLKGVKYIRDNLDLPFHDILGGVEKIVIDAVTSKAVNNDDDKFVDIYGDIEQIIAGQVNQKGNMGIDSPFPIFNGWFGQFLSGELYVFGAPAKVGKSTLLSAIVEYAIKHGNGKVKVLILDTELESNRVACRDLAAESGVNEYFFRTGKFTEDTNKVAIAKEAMEEMKKYKGQVLHRFVPSESIDQIESIARRWHNKHVDSEKGEIGLIVYDYLKLTNPSRSSSDGPGAYDLKEYELIGQITDALKRLSAELNNTSVVTAVQLNEYGQIAQSARIKWFATAIHILQRKSSDEIGTFGKEFGTHKLICVETRNLGEFGDSRGDIQIQRGNDTVWEPNYINLKFDNFRVTECGTYEDAIRHYQAQGNSQLPTRKTAVDRNKSTLEKYRKND